MQRLIALIALASLVLAFGVASLAATQTFTNDTGGSVTGIKIMFSDMVWVTAWDKAVFPTETPVGVTQEITFSGGTLQNQGKFSVTWGEAYATVTEYSWLTGSGTAAGSPTTSTPVASASARIPNWRPEYDAIIGSIFSRSSNAGIGGTTRIPNLGIQLEDLRMRYTTFLELLRRNTGNELEAVRDPAAIIGSRDSLHHGWGPEITVRIGFEQNGTHTWVGQVIDELNAGLGRQYFRKVSSGPADWLFDYSAVDYRNERAIQANLTMSAEGNPDSANFVVSGLFAFENDFKTQLRRAIVPTLLLYKGYDPGLLPRLGYDKNCFEQTAFSADLLHIVDVLSSLENGRDFAPDLNIVNQSPIAALPVTITARTGDAVQLEGSASLDPDGLITSYAWRQVFSSKTDLQYRTNNVVQLTSPSTASASFTPNWPGVYCFVLTAVDNAGASSEAELRVEVTFGSDSFAIQGISTFAYWDRTGLSTFIPHRLDDLVSQYGAKWIEFSPCWWMTDKTSSEVHPLGDGGASSPGFTIRDADLVTLIDLFHSKGLKVFLRPTLEFHNWTEWRGGLQPTNWTAWFQSYAKFIVHYAEVAERTGVEMLTVGVELKNSNEFTDRWRSIIRQVRAVYHGLLTYSDSELLAGLSTIQFWDDLDLISCSGYTAITGSGSYWETGIAPTDDPAFSDFVASIDRAFIRSVLPAHERYGKPVLVAEAGCANYDGANLCPWCWESIVSRAQDNNEQVMYFEALLQVLSGKDWIEGVLPFVWAFKADYNWQHEDWPISHELRLKPVSEVVRLWCGGGD